MAQRVKVLPSSLMMSAGSPERTVSSELYMDNEANVCTATTATEIKSVSVFFIFKDRAETSQRRRWL